MKQFNSVNQFTERCHRQIRKQQLQQKFRKSRQQLLLLTNQKTQKENFIEVLQKLDDQNYPFYKALLRIQSYNQNYNFNMLSVTTIIYHYLNMNPFDYDSIQILKSLSQYEQIQLPQNHQFAKLLMLWVCSSNLQLKNSGLEMISSLLGFYRYEQMLRDMLIENQILDRLSSIIQTELMEKQLEIINQQQIKPNENYVIIMITQILSSFVKSLPNLQLCELYKSCTLLQKITVFDESKWMIGNMFTQINSRFKQNEQLAKIINTNFQEFIIKQYNCIVQDCLNIFIYTIRSSYVLSHRYLPLIIKTIQSNPYNQNRKRALYCLLLSIDSNYIKNNNLRKFHMQQICKSQLFLQKMLDIFIKNPQLREDTIDLLHQTIFNQNQQLDIDQMMNEELIEVIRQCLVCLNNKIIIRALMILQKLLSDQQFIHNIRTQLIKEVNNLIISKNDDISKLANVICDQLDESDIG